jgi:hypothetical protein
MQKIEITKVEIKIGKKKIVLTVDEAKQLQAKLNNMFNYYSYWTTMYPSWTFPTTSSSSFSSSVDGSISSEYISVTSVGGK